MTPNYQDKSGHPVKTNWPKTRYQGHPQPVDPPDIDQEYQTSTNMRWYGQRSSSYRLQTNDRSNFNLLSTNVHHFPRFQVPNLKQTAWPALFSASPHRVAFLTYVPTLPLG
jgi:hypothetical protein